jgi:Transcription factor WhiB
MIPHSTDQLPLSTAATPPLRLPARPPSPAVAAMTDPSLQYRLAVAAKCAGSADDEIWFPASMVGHSAQQKYALHARAACLGCPVAEECLELALRAEDAHGGGSHGVRGAVAPWERAMMIRSRRRTRTAVAS